MRGAWAGSPLAGGVPTDGAVSRLRAVPGGIQQRVASARVIAGEAEVVLKDEIFGALDPKTRAPARRAAPSLVSHRADDLVGSHAVEEAIFLAGRGVMMSPGPGRTEAIHPLDQPQWRDVASLAVSDLRRMGTTSDASRRPDRTTAPTPWRRPASSRTAPGGR